jgi:putative membrane protein
MIEVASLPHVLAALNALTISALAGGYVSIRRRRRQAHKAFMAGAIFLGCAFLILYAYYKLNSGFAKFGGEGAIRPVYFSILFAHVSMAAVSLLLIPITVSRALRGRYERHKRIARRALPVWLFVAVSGLVVYVMAVHVFPISEHS